MRFAQNGWPDGAEALTARPGPMDGQELPETGGFVGRIRRVS